MKGSETQRVVAGALALLLLAAYVWSALRVSTDITHFLPHGERDTTIDLARRVAMGPLTRTMILLVDGTDDEHAAAVSRTFEAELRADARVAGGLEALDAGPPAGMEEALWQTYEPRRFAFLAPTPEAAAGRLTDAGIAAAVARLRQRLATPMSSLVSRVAPGDPFLVLPALFDRMAAGEGQLGVLDERFVADGRTPVLFLTTRAAASDSTEQRPLLDGVRDAFAAVQREHGGHLRLRQSGVHRHALAAEDSMRADIERVSLGSTLGFLATFLLLFGSLRPPLLCMPVLATGFLAGTAACLLAFGEVHGLTLAFGASLVGVSIDYAEHYFSHQALAPHANGPRATMSHLWRGLVLSAATTVVGFVALLLATFPGLRELALFASVGIAAALLQSAALLPGLGGRVRATRAARATVRGMRMLFEGPARRWSWLPIVAATAVIGAGVLLARWDDGVHNLNRVDPVLKAEDDAVHAQVARYEQRRVVVASAADEEGALAVNDKVAAVLADAQRAGEIGGFGNVAAWLPSGTRQKEIDAVVRRDATLWPRLRKALTDAGFLADAFEPFARALSAPAPEPLRAADLLATPLASLVRPFRLETPEGPRFLSFVRELRDEPALRARLAAIPGAQVLDVQGALTEALAAYRASMTTLLGLGVLGVGVLVWLRHRRARPFAIACIPALLGTAATIGMLALAGEPANLLSLVALLMVFSMGVDYGIFLAEDTSPGAHDVTYISISLASLTTVLGFGLLALSDQPALRCIGLTSAVGILSCLVLSFATSALLAPRAPAVETAAP